ncbi:MAG: nuclear transport factor 2 family protein [Phycisphaerales bacterium]|nr:nuclear transport factor 2 family protein [Phycisphaerales bacterium]
MPEPPDVSLVTRYVLENPWPLAIVMLALAAWLAWSGMREGLNSRMKSAAAFAVIGCSVLAAGSLIVTSSEHAERVTQALVDATVNGQTDVATNLFAEDAVFSVGSPTNPGFGREFIVNLLERIGRDYAIESNSITHLHGYSETRDRATVHLACWTELQIAYGPGASQWVVRVERQRDGSWKISHLTCVSVNNQAPPLDRMR